MEIIVSGSALSYNIDVDEMHLHRVGKRVHLNAFTCERRGYYVKVQRSW